MCYICLLMDMNLKQSLVTFCFTYDTNQVVSSLTNQSTSTSTLTCLGFFRESFKRACTFHFYWLSQLTCWQRVVILVCSFLVVNQRTGQIKDDLMMDGILNTTFHGHDDRNTKWRFFDVLFLSAAVLPAFTSLTSFRHPFSTEFSQSAPYVDTPSVRGQ